MSNQGDVENDEECTTDLKPESLQKCDMGACAQSWFTSLWSQQVTQKCLCAFHVLQYGAFLNIETWKRSTPVNKNGSVREHTANLLTCVAYIHIIVICCVSV